MVKKPVRTIVEAIARAAARWGDAAFPRRLRVREAVSERTAYSPRMVDYALDGIFGSLRREAIEAIVCDELGCLDVLDGFVARTGRPRSRALPVGRVCVISSRTTIGVAIVPAIFALCAKCGVLVKDREDGLVSSFFATLAEELPELGACAAATPWNGARNSRDLGGFAAVVAFGGDATLAQIASQLPPEARFIPYGSKASAGYVARDALPHADAAREIARRAAIDLLLYETEGCLSLHALFVERGGAVGPEEFGRILAATIRETASDFGAVRLDERRAAQLAMTRDLAAFHASAAVSDPESTYLLLIDPPWDEPPPFISRTLPIRSVDEPAQVVEYFGRHGVAVEALAIAGSRPEIAGAALRMGSARIASLGRLQTPALGDFHGGRPRIAEFVRWISDET